MLDPASVLSRRVLLEEPVSRAARLSRTLAGFAILTLLVGVAVARREAAGSDEAGLTVVFAALGAGLAVALAAVLCALLAFRTIWRTGRRGFGLAVLGLLGGVALLAWPSVLAVRAVSLPEARDASTDLTDPPDFSQSAGALRARGGRTPVDPGEDVGAAQRAAWPRLSTLALDVGPADAHALARRAARRMGWTVIESIAPPRQTGIGRLDAVERTLLLRFADDVTVRVRPSPDGGSRLDARSASRVGRHDLGANAARIVRFLDRVEELAREDGVQVRR